MEAIVSPTGEIVISAEVTSALDLKAGDHVSLTIEPRVRTQEAEADRPTEVSPKASLEEKIAFYTSPAFVEAATEHFRKARAAVARGDAAQN